MQATSIRLVNIRHIRKTCRAVHVVSYISVAVYMLTSSCLLVCLACAPAADTCNQTMLPNGDFEADPHDAYRITNWIKIKEKGANGGGIIGNGSDPGATGWPGYPFDNKNKYFKTQAFGNVGFALVNQYAIEVNSTRQILYFDWFMDNAFDYWLVPDTMSIHANNSNVTLHAARVDLFDFDKLEPPGNITQLAQYLFDPMNATAGPAYLGPALTVPDIIAFGNLQSVGSYVPLAPYLGKRVLVVFRYSTTVYYMTWGLDNVSVVTCDDSLGFYNRHHKRLRRLS